MIGIDIYFDMDGTLAYFNNNISGIEDLLEPNYFYNLAPIENMVQCVNTLLATQENDINIYILSSCINEDAKRQKNMWLDEHIPLLKKENRIFLSLSENKSDYVINKENLNLLIDDYNSNLIEFGNHKNFIPIKVVNDINDIHQTWTGERLYYTQSPFSLMIRIKQIFIQEMCKLYDISPFSSIEQRKVHNEMANRNTQNAEKSLERTKENFVEK